MSVVIAESYLVAIFSSPDLKNWTELSRYGPGDATTGGVWECPDIFTLPDPQNEGQNVTVLIVSVNPGGIAGGKQCFSSLSSSFPQEHHLYYLSPSSAASLALTPRLRTFVPFRFPFSKPMLTTSSYRQWYMVPSRRLQQRNLHS